VGGGGLKALVRPRARFLLERSLHVYKFGLWVSFNNLSTVEGKAR
jgi:hypothetical protein